MHKLREDPKLMKKAKFFTVVVIAGLFILGSLAIGAGLYVTNHLASSVNQFIQSPHAQIHVEQMKKELKDLPKINALNCWDQSISLLAIRPWLERPITDNLLKLQMACFEQQSNLCEEKNCEKNTHNIKDGISDAS